MTKKEVITFFYKKNENRQNYNKSNKTFKK